MSLGVGAAATSELDVIAGGKNGGDEASLDTCKSRTSDRERGPAEEAREGRAGRNFAVTRLDRGGLEYLLPPLFARDVGKRRRPRLCSSLFRR